MTSYQAADYGSSFPGNQPLYGPDDGSDPTPGFSNDQKPKILLMGLRRSGKSSIQNVVFHKMSPNETLFLESTNKITTDDIANTSFVQFNILDFPGQIDFFDPSFDSEKIFGGVGALVYVIDAQDDYIDAVAKLGETVSRVYRVNPKLKFEVFIHKVDGLTDDTKIETQRDIHQRASDDLHEASHGLENVHLNFYLTSIYDHSIFEAFSKVVQKLIPQLPTLENLLNLFNTNSGIEKAFLFDVSSKIYIATDYSPVDMQSYELCCDMIDVVLDISCIYGLKDDGTDHMSCFDSSTYSVIKLNNNTVLLLWEVARYLALVCILREENYDRPGLIECNYRCFREGLLEIFEVRNRYLQLEHQQLEHKLKEGHPKSRQPTSQGVGDTTDGGQKAGHSRAEFAPPLTTSGMRGVTDSGSNAQTNSGAVFDTSLRPGLPGAVGGGADSNARNLATAAMLFSDSSKLFNSATGEKLRPSTVAAEGVGYRTASDYVSPPPRSASEQYDRSHLRHVSPSPGVVAAPVRELVQGHVIHTGGGVIGGRVVGAGEATGQASTTETGVIGNAYVMTDDAGMVLVNGAGTGHGALPS